MSDETIKRLIYTTGKGVEIQVWDDGTVIAQHVREPKSRTKARTVSEALRGVVKKLQKL